MSGSGPWANGHEWPCPLFYTGNHGPEGPRAKCTCTDEQVEESIVYLESIIPASATEGRHIGVVLRALERAQTEVAELTGAIEGLADRWDAELQREFKVGEDYTDYHSRELRAVLPVREKQS